VKLLNGTISDFTSQSFFMPLTAFIRPALELSLKGNEEHRLDSVPVMLKQGAIIILTFIKIKEVFDKLTSFE